ncbi:hypothetical protein [Paenibacillus hodogayensis]
MRDFITEVVAERFDILTNQANKLDTVKHLREMAHEMESQAKGLLDDQVHPYFQEFSRAHDELACTLSHWFYVKGVQDGMQLLMFILLDEGKPRGNS